MAIPGLVTKVVKGVTIEGKIPVLSDVLGNSFGDDQGDGRWRKATSVSSMRQSDVCRYFYWSYRNLQEEVAEEGETAPVTGILATPVEAVGIIGGEPKGGEVHKLASKIAQQRAEKMKAQINVVCEFLPRENPLRVAYVCSQRYRSMSAFIATCPTPQNILF